MEMAERHEIGHGRLGLWGLLADRAGSLQTEESRATHGGNRSATGRFLNGLPRPRSAETCPQVQARNYAFTTH
jgi:hypothetical protein